jgi:preprotein translocase subunit SecA
MGLFDKIFGSYSDRELKRLNPLVDKIVALEPRYAAMSDSQLQSVTPQLRERLAAGESLDDILPEAFAALREASWRIIGLKHYPVQLLGGIVLHQGRIAEMKTGEGKTLVATLPSYLNALTGQGVHIVTVNDYMARRDSEWMGKVHRFMGLSVGLVVPGMQGDQKRQAYGCDITYCTNNELGFDYLRDNMVVYKEQRVQRGFKYAIVDEVDSILIDEARTPLIISGAGEESSELYEQVDRFVRTLKANVMAHIDSKEEQDELEGDYLVDEKARTATLTPLGVKKAERHFGIENLTDYENLTLSHHINQAIKAHGIMKRDVDYVVKDGEIIIVDEFTGRLMIGRRYNEGLHQAIEAKEGVQVARESKTLATITFQNFFRMYDKLAGMTGTALTEEQEFRDIYHLDVVAIPTNRPVVRQDHPDQVYKTLAAKERAVIEQIIACHQKGQPVLVGTVSIENSERLSALLSRRGIPHQVLNAKYHAREAQIVAQAGKYGAVTIATNMAGRGTDIKLGGNAEFMARQKLEQEGLEDHIIAEAMGYGDTHDPDVLAARERFRTLLGQFEAEVQKEAERVIAAGGLFILGTERHESRRIDNQLRGRSGRQGDPGESRFFLSLEDDLMRLFGGERMQNLMDTLKVDEDMPIEAKLLSSSIESAQSRVEGRNFQTRKNVLQFDDVMNRQREIIYGQRSQVLEGEDIGPTITRMFEESLDAAIDRYMPESYDPADYNIPGLIEHFSGVVLPPDDPRFTEKALRALSRQQVRELLYAQASGLYAQRTAQWGDTLRAEIERVVLLRCVDRHWMEHIDNMDQLRRGIYLRSYGQRDPVVEYRIEGFEMFDEMIAAIREDTVRGLLTVRIQLEAPVQREQVMQPIPNRPAVPPPRAVAARPPVTRGNQPPAKPQPVVTGPKIGRNDPCPCGSGLKYKKCCGK